MNKCKIVFSFIFSVFLLNTINSQTSSLKILTVAGDVYVGSSVAWEPAIVSHKLKNQDNVKVNEGGYIVLFDESKNKPLTINDQGTYKVTELIEKIPSKGPGFFQKFINLIKDELFSSNDNKEFSPGAVKRSTNALKIAMPESSKVMSDYIQFKWYKIDNDIEYCLTISDRYGEKVFEKNVSDTTYTFNIKDAVLKNTDFYFWKVASCKDANLKSAEGNFSILDESAKKNILDSLNIINSVLSEEGSSAFKEFALASFYSSKNLNFNALNHFEALASMPYFTKEFKRSYINFLARVSMVDKAELINQNK